MVTVTVGFEFCFYRNIMLFGFYFDVISFKQL